MLRVAGVGLGGYIEPINQFFEAVFYGIKGTLDEAIVRDIEREVASLWSRRR
jgi:hypothetical protein